MLDYLIVGLFFVVFLLLLPTEKLNQKLAAKNGLLFMSVLVAAAILPRLYFFYLTPADGLLKGVSSHVDTLQTHFWPVLMADNAKSFVNAFMKYLIGLPFPHPFTVVHASIAQIFLSVVSALLLARTCLALNTNLILAMVLIGAYSWIRVLPEITWRVSDDDLINLTACLLLFGLVRVIKKPGLRSNLILSLASVVFVLTNPINTIALPVAFGAAMLALMAFKSQKQAGILALAVVVSLVGVGVQVLKNYYMTGQAILSSIGPEAMGLSMSKTLVHRHGIPLGDALQWNKMPEWYKNCALDTILANQNHSTFFNSYWTSTFCYPVYPPGSACAGPDMRQVEAEILRSPNHALAQIVREDVRRACEEPYLFSSSHPHFVAKFPLEYLKVLGKVSSDFFRKYWRDHLYVAVNINMVEYEKYGPGLGTLFFGPYLENQGHLKKNSKVWLRFTQVPYAVFSYANFHYYGVALFFICCGIVVTFRRQWPVLLKTLDPGIFTLLICCLSFKVLHLIAYSVIGVHEGGRYYQYNLPFLITIVLVTEPALRSWLLVQKERWLAFNSRRREQNA